MKKTKKVLIFVNTLKVSADYIPPPLTMPWLTIPIILSEEKSNSGEPKISKNELIDYIVCNLIYIRNVWT